MQSPSTNPQPQKNSDSDSKNYPQGKLPQPQATDSCCLQMPRENRGRGLGKGKQGGEMWNNAQGGRQGELLGLHPSSAMGVIYVFEQIPSPFWASVCPPVPLLITVQQVLQSCFFIVTLMRCCRDLTLFISISKMGFLIHGLPTVLLRTLSKDLVPILQGYNGVNIYMSSTELTHTIGTQP